METRKNATSKEYQFRVFLRICQSGSTMPLLEMQTTVRRGVIMLNTRQSKPRGAGACAAPSHDILSISMAGSLKGGAQYCAFTAWQCAYASCTCRSIVFALQPKPTIGNFILCYIKTDMTVSRLSARK